MANQLSLAVLILAVCFASGAILTLTLKKFSDTKAKRAFWGKYWTYLIFVASVGACVGQGNKMVLMLIHLLLLLLAGLELFRAAKQRANNEKLLLLLLFVTMASLVLCAVYAFSVDLLLLLFAAVCMFDGFSQVVGQVLGKRPLMPKVSARKTWEGLFGGIVATQLATFLLAPSINSALIKSLLAAGIAFTSLLGDLSGSWYKRRVGIKDFSNLIPFHGGVLDRCNSYFMTLAFAQLTVLLSKM